MSFYTGKSMSEALIFASTKPQYDNRLFIAHENCKLRIPAEYAVYTNCSECQNKTQFVYKTCSESVLSLDFLFTELAIQ